MKAKQTRLAMRKIKYHHAWCPALRISDEQGNPAPCSAACLNARNYDQTSLRPESALLVKTERLVRYCIDNPYEQAVGYVVMTLSQDAERIDGLEGDVADREREIISVVAHSHSLEHALNVLLSCPECGAHIVVTSSTIDCAAHCGWQHQLINQITTEGSAK